MGHNQGPDMDDDDNLVQPQTLSDNSKNNLRNLIDRIERLEEEKTEVAGQIKEVYAEAKAFGFDTKAIRKVISIRKQDARERAEAQMMLDLYLQALGELL